MNRLIRFYICLHIISFSYAFYASTGNVLKVWNLNYYAVRSGFPNRCINRPSNTSTAEQRNIQLNLSRNDYISVPFHRSPASRNKSLPRDQAHFWGQTRTKEEIRRYCAHVLFPNEAYIRARKRINVISSDLPLIVIDDFLCSDMCNEIINAAKNSNQMKRSTMGVSQTQSTSRTSSTMWMHEEECEVPLRILAGKVSRLTGIEASHMENLQVVKYEEGQKFDLHTDHLDSLNDLDCKGRLATCLVYLNSAVDIDDYCKSNNSRFQLLGDLTFTGGETSFPEYNVDISPKCGRAVFWFNTLEKPGSLDYSNLMYLNADLRSRHCGKPVYDGEKFVCNRWVHPVPQHTDVRDDTGLTI